MTDRNAAALLLAAKAGSRGDLARLVSVIESGGAPAEAAAPLIYRAAAPFVIGLTGAPGAGKSTLTDHLLTAALAGDLVEGLAEIAVLCVDPTSPFSGGALLGDRVRMQRHGTDDRVFIRSMATRGHLGGLALAVPDATRAVGAAGFPIVLIETVGVGQMEVEVASMADTVVVVVTPGWGDSMQAHKAGLLEVADVFVINKADRAGVRETTRDLEQMLDLGPTRPWRPPIVETVATTGSGTSDLVRALATHRTFLRDSGEDVRRARRRLETALTGALAIVARESAGDESRPGRFDELVDELLAGATDPYAAARALLAS